MTMDDSVEQDQPPSVKKLKVSNDSIAIMDDGAKEPKETTAEPIQNADNESTATNTLSKRQRKKLIKLADWEEKKKVKRLKEREKYKQKRLDAIANGLPTRIGPSRKALKKNRMDDSKNPFTVAIDLDFDDLMIDKDICKCAKQLLWVYTINRKSAMPLHLHYTGLRTGGRIQQTLQRNDGYQNWDIKITEDSFLDIFKKEQIVYLTSDSENVLTELDSNAVYIIGGLVDHNHHKGVSLRRAEEKGLRTARLPLSENISIKTRTVLTIVHVFDILLKVSQGQSWQDALIDVLPSRKGAKPLDRSDDNDNVEES